MQTALEEDINLAENKEDVDKILLQKGKVKIDEVKVTASHAFVKGKVLYSILYRTLDNKNLLQNITGAVPFYEDIYINGLETGDHVIADGKLEDISVHIINSRKLNLRALLTLHAISADIKEEVICMDLQEMDGINTQKESFNFVEIVEDKRDIFRVRDEIELPKNMPNIASIVWKDIRLQNVAYKPMKSKIFIKGDLYVFVMYLPASFENGEENETLFNDFSWYETRLSFQGELECLESTENMLLDMQLELGNESIDIRQDIDQENRVIGIDCSLDINMHLYEPKEIEYVADTYGVKQEVVCTYKQFLVKNIQQQKSETIPLENSLELNLENEEIEKICYGSCAIHIENTVQEDAEETELKEGQKRIAGYLSTELLYMCRDIEGSIRYKAHVADYPFSMVIDMPQDGKKYQIHTCAVLEDYVVNLIGKDKVTVKADINITSKVYVEENIVVVSDIDVNPLNYDQMRELPGMLIYYVKNGDSLWQIGKKYYMDVEKIKELNHLKDNHIKKGDKLLLMKEIL